MALDQNALKLIKFIISHFLSNKTQTQPFNCLHYALTSLMHKIIISTEILLKKKIWILALSATKIM